MQTVFGQREMKGAVASQKNGGARFASVVLIAFPDLRRTSWWACRHVNPRR